MKKRFHLLSGSGIWRRCKCCTINGRVLRHSCRRVAPSIDKLAKQKEVAITSGTAQTHANKGRAIIYVWCRLVITS